MVVIATLLVCKSSHAQVTNGEFDNGLATWNSHGVCNIAISQDSHQTANACLVENRTQYWNGVSHNIFGDLDVGKDYHLKAYVKTKYVPSGLVCFEIKQYDDRGQVDLNQGEVLAVDDQWTLLQAGFTLSPAGQLTNLQFFINGSNSDPRNFDFLVDSITIEENDWEADSNQRIEQLRKRDVELKFTKKTGQPAAGYEVEIQQVRSHFEFGAALTDEFATFPGYADFYKSHFDTGTIEWVSQWKAIEANRNVENYALADNSVDFAQANGIKIRGHALAWPHPVHKPTWLLNLGASEVDSELTERIANVVSRYKSRIYSWDVTNELLDHTFFKDLLGDQIRTNMFTQTRQFDSNVELCTNEYGIAVSQDKARRYRELIEQLQTGGATVNKIGLQGHMDYSVSPKGIEIGLAELTPLGLPFRVSEYDFAHPDPVKRAQGLEDFYRYVFSRPEVEGITMWGFWAGAHWRGAEAALWDLDWTMNAAGAKYEELMNQWTTTGTEITNAQGEVSFRGFHGEYLIKTTNLGTNVSNYHWLTVAPDSATLQQELVFDNGADGTLAILGTATDDLFEYDFDHPESVSINGRATVFGNLGLTAFERLRFDGGSGDDNLVVKSKSSNQHFNVSDKRLAVINSLTRIHYDDIETASFIAQTLGCTVTILDSVGDDMLTSDHELTTLNTPSMTLNAEGFRIVFARSNSGDDVAFMYDSLLADRVYCDLSVVLMQAGSRSRRAIGFPTNHIGSANGVDILTIKLNHDSKSIELGAEQASIQLDNSSFNFSNFKRSYFSGDAGNTDAIDVVGDQGLDQLVITPDVSIFKGAGNQAYIASSISQVNYATETGGADRLIFFDSNGDDLLTINENTTTIQSNSRTFTLNYFSRIWGASAAGGTDTASVTNPVAKVVLSGDWLDP